MALIELASMSPIDCDSAVLCLDRGIQEPRAQHLMRDLGWVGFGLSTLDAWALRGQEVLSERWLFLKMDL